MRELGELTKNSVGRIQGDLVLGGIADQTVRLIESHTRWRLTVPQIIGYDLHPVIFPDCHTRVARSQVDPNCRTPVFASHSQQKSTEKASY